MIERKSCITSEVIGERKTMAIFARPTVCEKLTAEDLMISNVGFFPEFTPTDYHCLMKSNDGSTWSRGKTDIII